MNTKDLLKILHKPSQLQNEQIFDLEDVVDEYPYFHAARVLYLKGLKNQNSFRYNQNLKTTAIYTKDRSVLFHFITSNAFHSVLSNQQEKEIIEEIEVRDESIIENIYQNTDSDTLQSKEIDEKVESISIKEEILGENDVSDESIIQTLSQESKVSSVDNDTFIKTTANLDSEQETDVVNENILVDKDLIEQDINDFFNSKDTSNSEIIEVVEDNAIDVPDSPNLASDIDQTISLSEIDSVEELLDEALIDEHIDTTNLLTDTPENTSQDNLVELEIDSNDEYKFETEFSKNITADIFENTTDKIVLPEYSFEKAEDPTDIPTIETKINQAFSFEIDTHEEISAVAIENTSSLETSSVESNKEILRFELIQDDNSVENDIISIEEAKVQENDVELASNKVIETFIEEEKPLELEIDLDITTPIHFNKNDTHSFGEWMQLSSFKPIDRSNQPISKKAENMALIDEFMNKNPKIKPNKATGFSVDFNHIEKIEPDIVMTETLANVYIKQEKYQNAINAYEILSLKFPKKSSFFADQIKLLNTKLKNTSN